MIRLSKVLQYFVLVPLLYVLFTFLTSEIIAQIISGGHPEGLEMGNILVIFISLPLGVIEVALFAHRYFNTPSSQSFSSGEPAKHNIFISFLLCIFALFIAYVLFFGTRFVWMNYFYVPRTYDECVGTPGSKISYSRGPAGLEDSCVSFRGKVFKSE